MSHSTLILVLLGAATGIVGLFVFRASPRLTVVTWALVMFFIPVWVGVSAGVFVSAIVAITAAAVCASIHDIRLGAIDVIFAAFVAMVFVQYVLQLSTLSHVVIAGLEWTLPYIWGRLVLARTSRGDLTRILATVGTIAAVLAVLEFASGTNVFVSLPGAGPSDWSGLQERAGFIRAEGAFGHSIALGGALAMAAPFVVLAKWRPWITASALAAIAVAEVATFSRMGLLTFAITLALSVVLLPGVGRTVRWFVISAGAIAVAVVVPFLGSVFNDAGDEAGGSAAYRTDLFALVAQIPFIGGAGDWTGRVVDGVYFGRYANSVDNTLVLVGLRFGWVVVALFVLVFLAVAVRSLKSPNPAAIAVVGQMPGLVAVALITQYGSLLWFLVGVAVAWQLQDRDARALQPRLSLTGPALTPATALRA